MRHFRHSFQVDAEIQKVWDFYTNISHLHVISPPEMEIHVRRCTDELLRQGSEVWLAGKLVTWSTWHSRITLLRPYEYIDEMISGRFRVWKHVHRFEPDGRLTRVIDEIDFELPYGPLGRIFEGYVLGRLGRVFEYRKGATIRHFEQVR